MRNYKLRPILFAVWLSAFCVPTQAQRFIKVFDNIPALVAANPNDVHTNAFVNGLATVADGGGGIYTWKDGSTDATNADLSILKANNYATGRWYRFNGFIIAGGTNQFGTIYVTNSYTTNLYVNNVYATNFFGTNLFQTINVTNLTVLSTNTFITNFFFNNTYITNISQGDNWVANGTTNSDLAGTAFPWAVEATDHVNVGSTNGEAGVIAIGSTNGTFTGTLSLNDQGTFVLTDDVTDSASAVGFSFNTTNALSTPGAKLATFGNGGTNVNFLHPGGGFDIGKSVIPWWNPDPSDQFVAVWDRSTGEPTSAFIIGAVVDSSSPTNLTQFEWYGFNSGTDPKSELFLGANNAGFSASFDFIAHANDPNNSELVLSMAFNGETLTLLNPLIANGTTPYTLDTSLAHTSGNLLEVKNMGTNVYEFGYGGELNVKSLPGKWGEVYITSATGDSYIDLFADDGNGLVFQMADTSVTTSFQPSTANQNVATYIFNTSNTRTGPGNLAEFKNNGTNMDTIAAVSGWTGAGTKYKADDGTYKTISAGTTINPTDGYEPYRTSGTTFGNSPWYRIQADAMGFASTNWAFILNSTNLLVGGRNYNVTSAAHTDTAFGIDALTSLTSGLENTALGSGALGSLTSASSNTGIGKNAGNQATSTGGTYVGTGAGENVTSGSGNTMLGNKAGENLVTGGNNTFVGNNAGYYTTSSDGVAIGYQAGAIGQTLTRAVFIGSQAVNQNERLDKNFTDTIYIGYKANTQTNGTQVLTNSIYIGPNLLPAAPNEIVIGNPNQTKAVINIASYTGAGTQFLSDDGTYKSITRSSTISLANPTVTLTTGTALNFWPVAVSGTITSVNVFVKTASSSGSVTFEVKKNGTTILSAPVSISSGSTTATATVSVSSLTAGDIITGDVTAAGTGTVGAEVQILYTTP